MGWDRTGTNCHGTGLDATEKIALWTSLPAAAIVITFIYRKAITNIGRVDICASQFYHVFCQVVETLITRSISLIL